MFVDIGVFRKYTNITIQQILCRHVVKLIDNDSLAI